MESNITRRELMRRAGLAGGLAALGGIWTEGKARASRSANERLSVAAIGAGGQGGSDIQQVASDPTVDVVALCDVDQARAADTFKAFPKARVFTDFRQMLEQVKEIDAVTVSTPDHTHAPAAVMAMKLGKHVYCQKPLTHSVYEARVLMDVARKHKVVTQMGTQGHAFPSNIRAVELLQSGAIGPVREVHVVTDRPIWPQGMTELPGSQPVPATLAWDLWLGPREHRPYHSAYLPFVWRGWWDFGTGALGDMACHLMDVAFWALKLRYPTSVVAEGEPLSRYSAPKWSVITYQFPRRGSLPAVKMVWYDGGKQPSPETAGGRRLGREFNGSIFIGEKGRLLLEHAQEPLLLPVDQFEGFKGPDPYLPRPKSHYQQWVDACKGDGKTGSSFDYSGPLTEAVLLGNVAFRLGREIEYDPATMRARGCPEADALLREPYRAGWEL